MAMTVSAPDKRKFRLSLISVTGVGLMVGALVFVILLSDRFFVRFDWTADRRYSLSKGSVGLVNALEDPLLIRFYLSPGLPQPYESHGRYVRDLLHEFRSVSRGKVTVETVAPDGSEALEREFRRLNLQPSRFTQVGSDQFQVREGYIAIVLHYQDKQEVIPFVKNADDLEYEISSRLRVMSQKEKKTLFFISNHNEVSPNAMKEGPAGRLFQEFRVESLQLSKNDPGMKPDAVFLLGPQSPLTPEELEVLDSYASSGIPLVVALNRRVVFPSNFRSMAQSTGVEPFLEHYGVQVERDFVMDALCDNIGMKSRDTAFLVKYFPFIKSNTLNRENRALQGLDVLGFPFASALTSTLSSSSTLKFTWLAKSSPNSWVWPGLYNVDPPSLQSQWQSDPPAHFEEAGRQKDLGPFTLAAVVEGSTVTFRQPRQPVPEIKLVVIGTSFFANPQVPIPEGNALFILAMAHWLTQEGSDLSIPPKSSPYRPLKPVAPWARSVTKLYGFFLVPFLVVFAGVWHWYSRAARRETIRDAFSQREVPRA
jgi:hypothetical protein